MARTWSYLLSCPRSLRANEDFGEIKIMYLGNNARRTGGGDQHNLLAPYHPMILPSDSIEVGRQQHIDKLIEEKYILKNSFPWEDREKIEDKKRFL